VLPTFIIGLREGLEAALIVGIVAAFLKQQGRRDALRQVWFGVAGAVLICLAAAVALQIISSDLPQRQQEGLETIVGAIAVTMVTYMVLWMKRHSRGLKRQLEGAAGDALRTGSSMALVGMAFLAVLREGMETAVFLLAAFNASGSPVSGGIGAAAGILVAVLLGWGIYRGGVRINLSKFFRATGLVLVLVAAGLVVSALHTAHEAGWLNAGQQSTVSLRWLVAPGSVRSALLTGVLGLQPDPVLIEVVGWFLYLIPLAAYVVWPSAWRLPRIAVGRLAAAASAAFVVAGAVVWSLAPAAPSAPRQASAAANGQAAAMADLDANAVSRDVPISGDLDVSRSGASATVTPHLDERAGVLAGLSDPGGEIAAGSTEVLGGLRTRVYTGSAGPTPVAAGLPTQLTQRDIVALAGGRLPLGLRPGPSDQLMPVSFADTATRTLWIDPQTDEVVDAQVRLVRTLSARSAGGAPVVVAKVADVTLGYTADAVAAATHRARADGSAADRRGLMRGTLPWCFGVAALLSFVLAASLLIRRPPAGTSASEIAMNATAFR
jgi:high-affinity iron transporter